MQPSGRFSPGTYVLLMVLLSVFVNLLAGITHSETWGQETSGPPQHMPRISETISALGFHPRVLQPAGYILPSVNFLATIFHSAEERQSLAEGDRIVIDAGADKHLLVGNRLTIIRASNEILHPLTNQAAGTLVMTLGYATIVSVQSSTAILDITKAFDAIELGDHVKEFDALPLPVINARPPPSARNISGFILATKDDKVSIGTGDLVYLDQGKQNGVHIGDHFSVFQEGQAVQHPISHRLTRLPRQVSGELTVIDVRDHTATALVTSSQREFSAGFPVELRLAPDSSAVDTSAGREARVALAPRAETRLAQLIPCLEAAHQAIRTVEAAGTPDSDLVPAKNALGDAEHLLEQAKALLAHGEIEQAISHLEAAQADCLSAQELALTVANRQPEQSESYTVMHGDTLWRISAGKTIYRDPFMWPMIYKANRGRIRDPDLIFPMQRFTIPRDYSEEEANTARQRARTRGSWSLKDGLDTYILKGVRH